MQTADTPRHIAEKDFDTIFDLVWAQAPGMQLSGLVERTIRDTAHTMMHRILLPWVEKRGGNSARNEYTVFAMKEFSDLLRDWEKLLDRHPGSPSKRTKNCLHNVLAFTFAQTHQASDCQTVAGRQLKDPNRNIDDDPKTGMFHSEDLVMAHMAFAMSAVPAPAKEHLAMAWAMATNRLGNENRAEPFEQNAWWQEWNDFRGSRGDDSAWWRYWDDRQKQWAGTESEPDVPNRWRDASQPSAFRTLLMATLQCEIASLLIAENKIDSAIRFLQQAETFFVALEHKGGFEEFDLSESLGGVRTLLYMFGPGIKEEQQRLASKVVSFVATDSYAALMLWVLKGRALDSSAQDGIWETLFGSSFIQGELLERDRQEKTTRHWDRFIAPFRESKLILSKPWYFKAWGYWIKCKWVTENSIIFGEHLSTLDRHIANALDEFVEGRSEDRELLESLADLLAILKKADLIHKFPGTCERLAKWSSPPDKRHILDLWIILRSFLS